jgi:hypothetical protein
MQIHYCPVCGAAHKVHPILHALAYGRQLTCSPRCKTDFARVICPRILAKAANDPIFGVKQDEAREQYAGQLRQDSPSISCP